MKMIARPAARTNCPCGSSRASPRLPAVLLHNAARRCSGLRASSSDSPLLRNITFMNPAFKGVESEAQFMGLLQKIVDSGRCPPQLLPLWQDFFNNYKSAIIGSDQQGANDKLVAQVQASIADTVLNEFVNPYTFPSFHKRLLEPYNYYEFGQRYVASLTDFNNSVLGHPDRWARINALLEAGENVVLLANHQTEADPGVFAHMLKDVFPRLATDVIYVAGDRVVTDALCKPFSMGRNLFCVHSKKHLDDIPELKIAKMETNRKTLVAMSRQLNEGSCLMWIAPSGGRDRPKADGRWSPDPFDPTAVDLMRNLVGRAKKQGHLVPMAMYSYPMMPPPPKTEKDVGERRITNFTPVGISACEPLDVAAILAACGSDDKAAQQAAIAAAAQEAVTREYLALEAAILEPAKRGKTYVQPWAKVATVV